MSPFFARLQHVLLQELIGCCISVSNDLDRKNFNFYDKELPTGGF